MGSAPHRLDLVDRGAVADDGLIVCASEAGVVDFAGRGRVVREKLGPGQIVAFDPVRGLQLDRELKRELEALGHRVTEWQPVEEVPADAVVAVVDGMAGVEAAREVPCHLIALLTASESYRVTDCSRQLSDFVVKPIRKGELTARVNFLAAQPTWKERVLHRLFALAIERTSDIIEVTDPINLLGHLFLGEPAPPPPYPEAGPDPSEDDLSCQG